MSSLARSAPAVEPFARDPSLAVGDLVRTGVNLHPHYRVLALVDDKAWIRDVQNGTDHVVPCVRCRGIDHGRG